MKRNLAIYASLISVFFLVTSCLKDDEKDAVDNPYAAITGFMLKNFNVLTKSLTDDGRDTTFYASVGGSLYPFVIDQITREIYNPDSLPFGTNNRQMTADITSDGIAYIYSDSLNEFVAFSSEDTINYTTPKRLLVTSFDGRSMLEYSLKVNVHSVDPEVLAWNRMAAPEAIKPLRMVQFGSDMLLYGIDGAGKVMLCSMPLNGEEWSAPVETATLPSLALEGQVLLFNGKLWAVADGALYCSADGAEWNRSVAANDFAALLLAGEQLLAVADGAVMSSADGEAFIVNQPLPADFPVKNISSAIYPLVTNPSIMRSVVVGYSAGGGAPKVWAKLSNEEKWSQYSTHLYSCPAFEDLSVLRYDGKLYAIGGTGLYDGVQYDALSELFVSNDNGLTWLTQNKLSKTRLPAEVLGQSNFAVTVSDNDRIWLVAGGVLYRGGINRLINK